MCLSSDAASSNMKFSTSLPIAANVHRASRPSTSAALSHSRGMFRCPKVTYKGKPIPVQSLSLSYINHLTVAPTFSFLQTQYINMRISIIASILGLVASQVSAQYYINQTAHSLSSSSPRMPPSMAPPCQHATKAPQSKASALVEYLTPQFHRYPTQSTISTTPPN